MVVGFKLNELKLKVYSNRDNFCHLSHILPNQIRKIKQFTLYSTVNPKKGNIIARSYSTSSIFINNLNPFFITGLTDAEGSFSCIIKKSAAYKAG